MTRFVIDSYAILAVTRQELASTQVLQLIADPAHQHWMSVVNAGEVYYRTARENGVSQAVRSMGWLKMTPIRFMDVNLHLAEAAARIKSAHALSYADCFAAGLARQLQARVLTGDPEFQKLEDAGLVEIEWLPAKPKRTVR